MLKAKERDIIYIYYNFLKRNILEIKHLLSVKEIMLLNFGKGSLRLEISYSGFVR